MPDFAIVDAHVHLYDPAVIRYGWMRGRPVLDQPRLAVEFDIARGPVEVAAVVWIEAGADPDQHLEEAAFIADETRADPRVRGLVAAAPLEKGAAVAADIERLLQHDRLRGIRRLLQDEPPDFCLQAPFVEGVRLLARFDLSFDICVYHHQLPAVIELVRRCPEVRFVLDHIGKPEIRDGLLDAWRAHLRRLAALPNVWCKLSGVITEAGAGWRRDQIRPYIDHAIECFGCERMMFGSDWPVAEETHRYGQWVEIVDAALAGCSDDDREKLWRRTAAAFYRLDAAGT